MLTRARILEFPENWRHATAAMEACAASHFWRRTIATLGHGVRPPLPIQARPLVKRRKIDGVDAEAISEAAVRRLSAATLRPSGHAVA